MKYFFLTLLLFCSYTQLQAQDLYVGTFAHSSGNVVLKIKPVATGYQGVLQSANEAVAFRAEVINNIMGGQLYRPEGVVNFSAGLIQGGIQMASGGYVETF